MNNLSKVGENYDRDLPKVNEMTRADNFNLPKIKKMTYVTCPKLVIVTHE